MEGAAQRREPFFSLPKALFADGACRKLSAEARLLYAMLLDRSRLSAKNGWRDEQGEVFVYFTREQAMRALGCGHTKAAALFAALEQAGFIRRIRKGAGRPLRIYVRPLRKPDAEKRTFSGPENGRPDVRKTDAIKKEKNKTEKEYRSMGEVKIHEKRVEENIGYTALCRQPGMDRELLDEICTLVEDVMCGGEKTVRVGGRRLPGAAVRSRLLRLDDGHVQYVMECMQNSTARVRNIRAYLLTALYNAPATVAHYYAAQVKADRARAGP